MAENEDDTLEALDSLEDRLDDIGDRLLDLTYAVSSLKSENGCGGDCECKGQAVDEPDEVEEDLYLVKMFSPQKNEWIATDTGYSSYKDAMEEARRLSESHTTFRFGVFDGDEIQHARYRIQARSDGATWVDYGDEEYPQSKALDKARELKLVNKGGRLEFSVVPV